jgi:hypothetical protein
MLWRCNTLFRFSLPRPWTCPEDVFCLGETRRANGFRRISLFRHDIKVPNVQLCEDVDVQHIPGMIRQVVGTGI